ncbi:MAG: complex I subunit 1/NuoH family protein [Bacteroidota bacterium]
MLVLPLLTVVFVSAYALISVLAERKVSAWIQNRRGPLEVGPRGAFQTLADILKLLQKEHIVPGSADRLVFNAAPLVIFAAVFAGFAVVPLAPGVIGADLNIGILYALAIVSVDVLGIWMAGWGSNNKYSIIGGMRSIAQIVSYEIPAGLALLAAILVFGTLNLQDICMNQSHLASGTTLLFGLDITGIGGLPAWAVVRYPHLIVAFVIFFTAALAESNRAPFDLPEAESELVAGFLTEYSGFRFAVIFLAEYGNMLLLSLFAAVLFFGGWSTPLPNLQAIPVQDALNMSIGEQFTHLQFAHLTTGTPGTWSAVLWGLFWLLTKGLFLVFVMMWVRWTFPRLRPDQLLRLCWKYLTPAAMLLLVISAFWRLAEVGAF